MSGARGDGEASSAPTMPRPFQPAGCNKDDLSKAQVSALGGCADTTLFKSRFTSFEDLLIHL